MLQLHNTSTRPPWGFNLFSGYFISFRPFLSAADISGRKQSKCRILPKIPVLTPQKLNQQDLEHLVMTPENAKLGKFAGRKGRVLHKVWIAIWGEMYWWPFRHSGAFFTPRGVPAVTLTPEEAPRMSWAGTSI
jgi:hypothetical protein